jgi:hypothetical protein
MLDATIPDKLVLIAAAAIAHWQQIDDDYRGHFAA